MIHQSAVTRVAVLSLSVGMLGLAGCAMPVQANEMAPLTAVYDQMPPNPRLERSIAVGAVQVADAAKARNGIDGNQVQAALSNALLASNYKTRTEEPTYLLETQMVEAELPVAGFNYDCYVTANYTLRSKKTGNVASMDRVKSHYHAGFGEAFDATTRLQICLANSLRENITHYLRLLGAKTKKDLQS